MKQIQKGFTLIELMIVVAIIGILAAVAIPAYQDYIARSQVAEPVQLLGAFKTTIEESFATSGAWPDNFGSNKTKGTYVASVVPTEGGSGTGGTVVATMNATGTGGTVGAVSTETMTYTVVYDGTDGKTTWTCGSSIADNLLPKNCRSTYVAP